MDKFFLLFDAGPVLGLIYNAVNLVSGLSYSMVCLPNLLCMLIASFTELSHTWSLEACGREQCLGLPSDSEVSEGKIRTQKSN